MKRFPSTGFTLLEIMLVLVVMGLIATSVAPRLGGGNSGRDLRLSAEQLVLFSQAAHQSALVQGRSLGLQLVQDKENARLSYQFLGLHKGKWQVLEQERMLRKVVLPENLTIDIKNGASFWREAIDNEQPSGSFQVDPVAIVDEPVIQPDIYFWSSGEISPLQARLCISNGKRCRDVLFEETGEVYDRDPI